jgi:hypothetical protein
MEHNTSRNDQPYVLAEVGGVVDESRVNLAIYGDDLDPGALSATLGCAPSHSHRKGDCRSQSSPPSRTGAWILTVEGRAPRGPRELIDELLALFPVDAAFWRDLTETYQVSVRVGIHTGGWNRGFDLPVGTVTALAQRCIGVEFDLYFYGDEDAQGR